MTRSRDQEGSRFILCGSIPAATTAFDPEPKTKKNRVVPINSTLRLYFDKWRLGEGTWLFPSPAGVRWDADNFSSDLRAANDKAKLPWGSLDFRHTFGSQLAMKSESLDKISTLIGIIPEICRRHYAALIPEASGDSVECEVSPVSEKLHRAATA